MNTYTVTNTVEDGVIPYDTKIKADEFDFEDGCLVFYLRMGSSIEKIASFPALKFTVVKDVPA